ncbi:leucine--tRNA ligase [Candidatus Gottesmanbacteria bacterium]|nr:leucine--tRNA ligase [Candidatus Gottesmanbacteria bacterium]
MKQSVNLDTSKNSPPAHFQEDSSGRQARYDHRAIEAKWAKIWKDTKLNEAPISSGIDPSTMLRIRPLRPYYNLMMFPYPSAEGLHVGNMYAFTGSDIFGRYMRMKGYDVFEPIGLDGFGIHSENFALKIGRHPMDHAVITEKNFYAQLSKIGAMFDWSRTVETYNPNYYRWTQWLFVQMFKQGLAYRAKASVNYCPSCKTVLADEQVIDGLCERCKSVVEKRLLEQWFFRITTYAERLLGNLDGMDWTEKVKIAQKNWIGKKEGIEIHYPVKDTKEEIVCFTTAPVNFGMTFIVISPQHEFVAKIVRGEIAVSKEKSKEIAEYAQACAKRKKEVGEKEKTGVNTGLFATNRVAGWDVPIWISDFVVKEVGTGAVQGCPAHDTRDFEFARKFGLPIKRVVMGPDGDMSEVDTVGKVIVHGMNGTMVNSEFLNGLPFEEGLQKTMDFVEKKGWGKRVSTYHLRDWLISRQRYWGPPIPMIYCGKCAKVGKGEKNDMPGWYSVPEKDLPVVLPRIEDYKPGDDGIAPLAKHKEFFNVACPSCGSAARRETDVSDTFLDSSWYFLRYPSVGNIKSQSPNPNTQQGSNLQSPITNDQQGMKNSKNTSMLSEAKSSGLEIGDWKLDIPWNPEVTRQWLPVEMYTGGAEHSVLHLLYSRFIWKALRDWGYLDFSGEAGPRLARQDPASQDSAWDEPFSTFFAHGLVIKDGSKMSKSKGNVVNPDEYIATYGADALRIYLMFMGPFSQGGDFRDSAMEGVSRWLNRVWRIVTTSIHNTQSPISNAQHFALLNKEGSGEKIAKALNKLVKKVGEDMEHRRYNTAIASMMEFTNLVADARLLALQQGDSARQEGGALAVDQAQVLVKLLAPLAPHLAEEMWELLNQPSAISRQSSDKTGELKEIKSETTHYPLRTTNYISVHIEPWPEVDESILAEDEVTVAVQINGKTRATIVTSLATIKEESAFVSLCQSDGRIKKYLDGKTIVKTIVVPGKLINFVIE